ncbi:MAG: beta-propeller fold lactonase family protein [Actinobacteria bacterium]|nr:beta-propeller fold lactonase family protein [Actinomycetota bacterium]
MSKLSHALHRLSAPASRLAPVALVVALALLVLAPGVESAAASPKHPLPPKPNPRGTLVQLTGAVGCVAAGAKQGGGCARARALAGPGPFMGSHAIAISPDGRNVYVAASKSNAITVFSRDPRTGALRQPRGTAGCVAARAEHGCGLAVGLIGPNSVAVSPDGRNVYATARGGDSVLSFQRNRKTGALRQLPPASSGCISGLPVPSCAPGRALSGPDVVAVSPDGGNVYVGSFFGSAVASFARDPAGGALTQLEGSAGCIALATGGCGTAIALGAVEGLEVSPDGSAVYAAAAASGAVAVLARDPASGALTQSSCIVDAALQGCATGVELGGANAVAASPDGGVYVTSLLSNSVTTFTETEPARLFQKEGPAGCLVFLRSAGCSFGRAIEAPEGLAVSPDGRNVYVAAFETGAIDVLARNGKTGAVQLKPGKGGCVAPKSVPGCGLGRALAGASSVAVSPDGRNVYSTAFASNAVDVFRRIR